jgi:hypothetical protein
LNYGEREKKTIEKKKEKIKDYGIPDLFNENYLLHAMNEFLRRNDKIDYYFTALIFQLTSVNKNLEKLMNMLVLDKVEKEIKEGKHYGKL